MPVELINKLLESFGELEKCIAVTKDVLHDKPGVPGDIINRVNQYSDIVLKQRGLASELEGHIAKQDWDEVTRIVKIINGLSNMIREDAQSILAGAYAGEIGVTPDQAEKFLS